MGNIDIFELLGSIWNAKEGGIYAYFNQIDDIVAAIIGIILAFMIIKDAINLFKGKGFTFIESITKYFIVCLVLVAYKPFATNCYNSNAKFIANTKTSYDQIKNIHRDMYARIKAMEDWASMGILGPAGAILRGGTTISADVGMISARVLAMFMGLFFDMMILGIFVGYAFVLVTGPIFIVFFMWEKTRTWGMNWLQNLLSYEALFLFMFLGMQVIWSINAVCYKSLTKKYVEMSTKAIFSFDLSFGWDVLMITTIPVAVIFVAIKAARSLFGVHGIFGSDGATAASMGAAFAQQFISKAVSAVQSAARIKGK